MNKKTMRQNESGGEVSTLAGDPTVWSKLIICSFVRLLFLLMQISYSERNGTNTRKKKNSSVAPSLEKPGEQ